MFTLEELRKLDSKKIIAEIREVEKELFKVKFEVRSGQGKSSHLSRNKKKYIAQMQTVLTSQGVEPVEKKPAKEVKTKEAPAAEVAAEPKTSK